MSLKFKDEEAMRKAGIVIDPNDPSKAIPIGQLADRQQDATVVDGQRCDAAREPNELGRDNTPVPASEPNTKKAEVSLPTVTDAPQSAESFTRETSGAIGDLANWDDQALAAGMRAECAALRTLDANYPARYHRLGTVIIESTKRFGEEAVRLTLRAEGISTTRAYYAKEIGRLYTYEQAIQFASFRAIKQTIPPKQPRRSKRNHKVNMAGDGDHRRPVPPPDPPDPVTDEDILDQFVRLGIEVKELLGDEALDRAVEQIKAHVAETLEDAFAEV
jgi:hypothetical protein